MKILWHKLNEKSIIPTKRTEDAGFDIYTIEDNIILEPFSKHLFSTGLAAAAPQGYWLMAFDRGSTGSKGIHTHCGVVDNGYRGEIFICLSNDNDFKVIFTSAVEKVVFNEEERTLYYPTSKAIAQLIPIPQPSFDSKEATEDEWKLVLRTDRGTTKLGESGK